jgi:hypothetical protein
MTVHGNTNVDAVRSGLDSQVLKGRSAVEAAGELLWLTEQERANGVLSSETESDRTDVILEWLADELNVTLDDLGPSLAIARMYAAFLSDEVDIKEFANPPAANVDKAWREWREAGGRK